MSRATSIALATLVLASCGSSGEPASAESCARVVQQFRGLPNPVAVTHETLTAEGQVEIAYESFDGENLPVSGSASCTFAVGGPGSLDLEEAIVDGAALGAAEVAAANRALASRP